MRFLFFRPRKRKGNEWTEEETEELRNLYEEFKSTDGRIVLSFSFFRSNSFIPCYTTLPNCSSFGNLIGKFVLPSQNR